MLITTRGIVLRQTKYSDTSLICTVFTEALGLQSYIVNGARKHNARQPATLLRPMNLLDMVVYYREGKNLQRIKEVRYTYLYSEVLFDITKGAIGLFMIEVLNKVLHQEEENQVLFAFLFDRFVQLDRQQEGLGIFLLTYLLELSRHLGFWPQRSTSSLPFFDLQEGVFLAERPGHPNFINAPQSTALQQVLEAMEAEQPMPALHKSTRKTLLGDLLRYFELHVDGFREIKSHAVLESVFSSH